MLAAALALAACLGARAETPPTAEQAPPVPAQPSDPTRPPSRFHKWTIDTGLPQSSVYGIAQSRDGYIWVATLDGLVRFDGLRFTVFNATNTPGFAGNRFTTLFIDRDDALWVGSEEGRVFKFRDGVATEHRLDPPVESTVVAFRQADDGTIWVAIRRALYTIAPGEQVARYAPVAEAVTADPKCKMGMWGSFAIFAPNRLVHFADGTTRTISAGEGLPDLDGGMVYEGGNGVVWIVPRAGPLQVLDGGRVTTHPSGFVYEAQRKHWFALLEDRRKNLWIGVPGRGIVRVGPDGRQTVYGDEHGVEPGQSVQVLFEDREGNVWAGTQRGLFEFKGDLVQAIGERDGLGNENTKAVCEGRDGTVWVVGGAVLNAYRAGTIARHEYRSSRLGPLLTALCEDRDGRLWVGTDDEANGSLCIFEDGRFVPVGMLESASLATVRAILQDRAGAIWLATSRGVVRRRGPRDYVSYTTDQGLPSNDAKTLLEDRDGAIWVGTAGGLARISDGRVATFAESRDRANNHVRSLYQDDEGVLWVGTYDGGLIRLAEGRFARITTAEGLHNDGVFAILEDGLGNFWMSSNVGLFRVRRQELEEVAAGRSPRVWCVPYRRDDGMLNSECNGGWQPSATRSSDGRLWFASQGGVVVVDPRLLPHAAPPPVPVIEGLVVAGAPLSRGGDVEIEPSQESLEIQYTAPTFIKPELARFRYRLEGLDESWVEMGVRRSVYFTHLPSGEYVFRLAASSSDGRWNESTASLRVRVLAPFWRSWWAYALYGILLASAVYAVVRLRVRALSRRGRELEELVAVRTNELAAKAGELARTVDQLSVSEQQAQEANRAKSVFLANMSHELRTPLNAVIGFVQLMERDQGRSKADREGLAIIRRSGEHLLSLINDVLSIAKIEAGRQTLAEEPFEARALLGGVEQMIRVRAEGKGLDLVVEIDAGLPQALVGDEGKLRQVLINLLGNAVKFTERGEVRLDVRWTATDPGRGRLAVEVADTGPGIEAEELGTLFEPFGQTESGRSAQEGTGLGLAISRQMVRLMGGEIWVASDVGRGTRFGFELELRVVAESKRRESQTRVRGLAPGQRAARLLVVDDTRDNRVLLGRLLESVGFEVRLAENGAAAVEQWEAWLPDLIWMDMRMPTMDGREATREIRRRESAERSAVPNHCVIIALTASAFEHEREEVLAAGCDDFVAKPWREEVIFEKLASHLGVEYDCEGDSALSAERFVGLGANVGSGFIGAMRMGNHAQALEALGAIRAVDPELADELERAITSFDLTPLFDLIDEVDAIGAGAPSDTESR